MEQIEEIILWPRKSKNDIISEIFTNALFSSLAGVSISLTSVTLILNLTRQTLNKQNMAMMNNRKSIRLKGYDYTSPGAYFITICTKNHVQVFGKIVDGKMVLNGDGQIVRTEWINTPIMRSNIEIDEFVIMPNHLHGIIIINNDREMMHRPLVREKFGKPTSNSIPTIIRGFRSAVTSRLNKKNKRPGFVLWQRNYWEHIIRNEQSMNQLREYIKTNPLRWRDDCFHGENQS